MKPSATLSTFLAASLVVISVWLVTTLPGSKPPSPLFSEAEAARQYLRETKPEPLSGPLQSLLDDPKRTRTATESHPLLNQPAPAFSLPDTDDHSQTLETYLKSGPVVLVFYYGYSCNHCVSQLFDLNEDLKYFRELGATVVAIGPDATETTRKKYAEFGAFGFPVLADVKREVASRYGLYRPAMGEAKEWQAHGTFVIDRRGVVRWANTGPQPFTGNVTLLAELLRNDPKRTTTGS